jgi:GNAT superfamily N-acetyltransferase
MILLTTPRLTMRPIAFEDWSLFLKLNQSPGVMKYIGDIETTAQIRHRFEQRVGKWDKYSDFWLCLVIRERETGRAVGLTGFFPDWRPYQQAEVGFMLLPDAQGKGYGKESLREVLNYAFTGCRPMFWKEISLRDACWKAADSPSKAPCVKVIVCTASGIMTGCWGCSKTIAGRSKALEKIFV